MHPLKNVIHDKLCVFMQNRWWYSKDLTGTHIELMNIIQKFPYNEGIKGKGIPNAAYYSLISRILVIFEVVVMVYMIQLVFRYQYVNLP